MKDSELALEQPDEWSVDLQMVGSPGRSLTVKRGGYKIYIRIRDESVYKTGISFRLDIRIRVVPRLTAPLDF